MSTVRDLIKTLLDHDPNAEVVLLSGTGIEPWSTVQKIDDEVILGHGTYGRNKDLAVRFHAEYKARPIPTKARERKKAPKKRR
jgi:hypothetical protein